MSAPKPKKTLAEEFKESPLSECLVLDQAYLEFLQRNSEMIAKWPKWKRDLFERCRVKK